MIKKIVFLFVIVPYFLFAQSAKETEIVILHVNDIHGRIDKIPYLSTMVKDIKAKHKNVLLFSAGDLFSGNPIVDKFSDPGFPMIDLMNMLPFSLSTIGNHEFDFGGEILAKRIAELKHPVVACNITKMPKYFTKPKPFEVFTIDGVQMAVIGVAQVSENGFPDTHPDRVKDFGFMDGKKMVRQIFPTIKKYPVRIILSHMGVDNDSILATQEPTITAIIGGHSHKALQPMKVVNGVPITQAENYLKYLGMMTIKISGNKVFSVKDTLLLINKSIAPDSVVQRKVEFYNNNEEFKKIAGYVGDTIKGELSLGSFMTDALQRISKADIAVQNSGGIRVHMLPKGAVTVKQIYEMDPFGNELMVCKMKPENLREMISFGYYKEGKLDIFSAGFKSKIYLNDANKIAKIELLDNANQPLDENKIYNVAMGSYLCNAYRFGKQGETISTKMTTTDAIFKFLLQIKSANYSGASSTEIIHK